MMVLAAHGHLAESLNCEKQWIFFTVNVVVDLLHDVANSVHRFMNQQRNTTTKEALISKLSSRLTSSLHVKASPLLNAGCTHVPCSLHSVKISCSITSRAAQDIKNVSASQHKNAQNLKGLLRQQ